MTDRSRMSRNRDLGGRDSSRKKESHVNPIKRIYDQASGAGSDKDRHSDASSLGQLGQRNREGSRGKQAQADASSLRQPGGRSREVPQWRQPQERDLYSPQALRIDASSLRQPGGRSREVPQWRQPQERDLYSPQALRIDASSSRQSGQRSRGVPQRELRFSLAEVATRGERARERGPRNDMGWRGSPGDRQRRSDVRHSTERSAISSPLQEQSPGRRMRSGSWSSFSSLLRRLDGIRGIWSSLVKTDKIKEYTKVYDIKKKTTEGRENGIDTLSINVEKVGWHDKGDIKKIASATTGKNNPNQDSSFISKYGAGVFDGVGGQSSGEVASGIAKEFFKEKLSDLSKEIRKLSEKQIEEKLNKIMLEGNEKIRKEGKGGATTLSVVIPRGDGKMTAVNVGDSRVYVLTKDGQLRHITTDDSVSGSSKQDQMELQKTVANLSDDDFRKFKGMSLYDNGIARAIHTRNGINQAMGHKDGINPEIVTFDVNPGDKVIITSDGVHDNLSDQEIIDCISKGKTAEKAADILVKTARERSLDQTCARAKLDDTTAVVMDIREK